jgi:hypothetical protein
LRSIASERYGRRQITSENRRGEMLLFPLQLTVPRPPKLPTDKRQARFLQIVENLAAQTGVAMVSANVTDGYYAAAVDLGALQAVLLEVLGRFSHAQIESRWDQLLPQIHATLGAWVQRRKSVSIDLRANGIHIRFETQDDHGYYHYEFDVMSSDS